MQVFSNDMYMQGVPEKQKQQYYETTDHVYPFHL